MTNFDTAIFNAIHSVAGQARILDWLIIFLGQYLPYFLAAGAILLVLKTKDFRQKVYNFSFIVLSTLLSRFLLTEIIRLIYNHPRPFEVLELTTLINHDGGGALPSGHAAFYFALALAIFFIHKRLGWWYLGATAAVALARVVAGVHWPLDIVAGAVVAFISVFAIRFLLARTLK